MQQLVSRITTQTGVPETQVAQVIYALACYVKEKYPLLSGTVDLVLEQGNRSSATS